MKLEELLNESTLLEGKRLAVYESLLPLLLVEEDGGGDGGGMPSVGDSTGGGGDITGEPVQAPPVTGSYWGRGPLTGIGLTGGGRWFNELYNAVKNLLVLNRMTTRMTQVGVGKNGQIRVRQAAKTAAKSVKSLLSNPGATAYRIPQWTFDSPKTPKIKRWNEGFAHEFRKELAKLNEYQMTD